MKARFGYRPKKTGETVDRRQNNGSVKAVSPRHGAVINALRNCSFNCRAWAESQRQCPLHCSGGTSRSERSPTFAAQHHLPAHDLFWANLKVHLRPTSLLLISPGTLVVVTLPTHAVLFLLHIRYVTHSRSFTLAARTLRFLLSSPETYYSEMVVVHQYID